MIDSRFNHSCFTFRDRISIRFSSGEQVGRRQTKGNGAEPVVIILQLIFTCPKLLYTSRSTLHYQGSKSLMAKRSIAQKRQQKALKRKKKRQAQHASQKSSAHYMDEERGGLPKLSETLLAFANPILGGSNDRDFIESTIGMIIMSWNIGTVEYQKAEEMREELSKMLADNLHENDSQVELEQELDLLIATRRTLFEHDPRLVFEFNLSWNMDGNYDLQVMSINLPQEARFDPYDKQHVTSGLSAQTQQSISELETPATEEQAPIVELVEKGYKLLKEDSVASGTHFPEVCDHWLEAWEKVKALYQDTDSINSVKAFAGMRLSYWCSDLEMYLYDAGSEDPVYFKKRIQYCREFCHEFPASDAYTMHNMIRGEAESLFFSGQFEQGEAAFEQLVEKFSDNAWSYIGWADMYNGDNIDLPENLDKAERLYRIPVDRQLEDADVARERLDDLLTMRVEMQKKGARIIEHEA